MKKYKTFYLAKMNFYHWSISNNLELKPKVYEQDWLKPKGFWVSKNNEWKEWNDNSGFLNLDFFSKYQVELDLTYVLIINTLENLKQFCKKYKNKQDQGINWNLVQYDYKGIYFDNYKEIKEQFMTSQSLLRTHTWYLAVDINSCCVFDITIIKSLKLL